MKVMRFNEKNIYTLVTSSFIIKLDMITLRLSNEILCNIKTIIIIIIIIIIISLLSQHPQPALLTGRGQPSKESPSSLQVQDKGKNVFFFLIGFPSILERHLSVYIYSLDH